MTTKERKERPILPDRRRLRPRRETAAVCGSEVEEEEEEEEEEEGR